MKFRMLDLMIKLKSKMTVLNPFPIILQRQVKFRILELIIKLKSKITVLNSFPIILQKQVNESLPSKTTVI